MVKIKLPQMTEEEINSVLKNENICRIAFIEDSFPYICPFQYVYYKNHLYFHFTDYGKKMKILSKNNNVCVSIEKLEPDLSSYFFISIQGTLIRIEDKNTLKVIVGEMINKASSQFSKNFQFLIFRRNLYENTKTTAIIVEICVLQLRQKRKLIL